MDWNGREFVERKVRVFHGGDARAERKWAELGAQFDQQQRPHMTSLEAEFHGDRVPRPKTKPFSYET
jgi:hypothetical protein